MFIEKVGFQLYFEDSQWLGWHPGEVHSTTWMPGQRTVLKNYLPCILRDGGPSWAVLEALSECAAECLQVGGCCISGFIENHQCFKSDTGSYRKQMEERQQCHDVWEFKEIENKVYQIPHASFFKLIKCIGLGWYWYSLDFFIQVNV